MYRASGGIMRYVGICNWILAEGWKGCGGCDCDAGSAVAARVIVVVSCSSGICGKAVRSMKGTTVGFNYFHLVEHDRNVCIDF